MLVSSFFKTIFEKNKVLQKLFSNFNKRSDLVNSFEVYSPNTQKKINQFFDQLLNCKICLHTQEGDKHFYQKVQACYSVTSTVEKGKIINYTLKLNPIFCYKVFEQKFFYEPFLNFKHF